MIMMTTGQGASSADQVRNKYNTLTPAEAKKLNRSLFTGANLPAATSRQPHHHQCAGLRQAPIRTASVLHKPRAPPIIVTDLGTTIDQLDGFSLRNHRSHTPNDNIARPGALNRSASIRSASICPTGGLADGRRHTFNHSQTSAMNSRSSLSYSGASSAATQPKQSTIYQSQHLAQRHQQSSLEESISDLSFKSSLDCPIFDPMRMQTVSVDLGNHCTGNKPQHDPALRGQTIARIKYNTLNSASSRLFSGESYSSTQSGMSTSTLRPASVTPSKSGADSEAAPPSSTHSSRPARSASKPSLSASTYKVFQSPFANFKRLLRSMPRPFAGPDESTPTLNANFDTTTTSSHCNGAASNCNAESLGDLSISDSISQLGLNKSQSPPACPPPPGELKSMCYMESAINYSNYDEFTKARNERMAQRQQAVRDGLDPANALNHHHLDDRLSIESHDSEAWQMTSLPVYYERNLTTVFEEKQASCEMAQKMRAQNGSNADCGCRSNPDEEQRGHLIRPPTHFDDSADTTLTSDNINTIVTKHKLASNGSMQSLNSCATTGSGYHQAPATPYRFSFAQPLQPPHESCVNQVSNRVFSPSTTTTTPLRSRPSAPLSRLTFVRYSPTVLFLINSH